MNRFFKRHWLALCVVSALLLCGATERKYLDPILKVVDLYVYNLTVDNDVAIEGDWDIAGDTRIGGTLDVTSNTTVGGTSTLAGVLTVNNNLVTTGTLDVTGNTTLSGTLDVAGTTDLAGVLTVGNNVVTTGTLDVTGVSTLASVDVTAAATVGTTLDVTGNATVGGTFDVTGTTDLAGVLTVGNNVVTTGTLDVTGVSTFASVDVTGAVTVGTTLDVTGNATVGGTFDVTGTTDLVGVLTVGNNVVSTGTLTAEQIFAGTVYTTATITVEFDGGGGDEDVGVWINVIGANADTILRLSSEDDVIASGSYFIKATSGATEVFTVNGGGDVGVLGDLTTTGTLDVIGASTLASVDVAGNETVGGTLDVTGATTLNEVVFTLGVVSLTSPTVEFSVDGLTNITLNSDDNQTGLQPIGGVVGQIIEFTAGAGSHTMRFDDGTSLTIGGNITLTEGEGDVLSLRCTQAPDFWVRRFNVDN